jgi:pimeloyl-ACP methyl ester carboxylesterase
MVVKKEEMIPKRTSLNIFRLGVSLFILVTACCASTPPIDTPRGIAVLEQITLGGLKQWVLIRGDDTEKPLLLFLHGGPGMPAIPFEHEMRELEESFIVVIWDQRGAGKSYSDNIPKESMNIRQFVADTYELIQMLLKRFHKERLYLIGHSCGSILGVLTVQQHPELIYAYIGIGQIADMVENERLSYEFVLNKALESKNEAAITELRKIQPPYRDKIDDLMIQRKWLGKFGGVVFEEVNYNKLIAIVKEAPEYTVGDLLKIEPGSLFSTKCLWDELLSINFFKQAAKLDVPVYFFLGRHDYNTPFVLAEEYFAKLVANKGKQIIWFEDSAHIPILEEREKFINILTLKVLPETYNIISK